MSSRFHYGKFVCEADLIGAVKECRQLALPVRDAFTPYPIHGLEALLGLRRSRLPFVALVCGAIGLGLALWFQYWSSAVDWPLNVGGKPFDSLPAFIPVAFELMVLFAGLGTAFALFVRSGLRPGKISRIADSRITSDRFLLVVEEADARITAAQIEAIWNRNHAIDYWSELSKES